MTYERKQMEAMVLEHYLGGTGAFKFSDDYCSPPYLRIAVRTKNGKIYVLRIELDNYPAEKPNAYVECMLRDCHGRLMNDASSANHTLSPHRNGWTQICHYHPSAWRADMSLWLVYVRCNLWLNIYEETLRTGRDMQYYLQHMSADYTDL